MKNIYDSSIEEEIYNLWDINSNIIFNKKYNKSNKNYSIILPPLNITGNIHIGHSFQHSIMDFLIRLNKMKGKNILWQYGLDHAGIATQIIIEKKLNIYNNLKHSTKYKYLNKELWIWKNNIENKLNYQIKRMGNLIDTSNKRFTLDKKFNKSVNYAFIKLYNDNYIYKDIKIVNWDTKLRSAISDLEVYYKNSIEKIYNIKFPIIDNNNSENKKFIVVSTTRPETILGDTAIAVNPNDKRYINLIGKSVLIPIINRIVPIISDNSIKINKWTGCVKITPAHNIKDYEIGIKNSLPIINIFNKNGNIKKFLEVINIKNKIKKNIHESPKFLQYKNVIDSRKIIINKLLKLNLLDNIKEDKIYIPYSIKSNSIIENIVTNQWFLKTNELSFEAINVIKDKIIKFIPKKYENIYFNWMYNIKDWCISRQILWGHKIPAWYDINNNIYVGLNEKYIRNKYKINTNLKLRKDNDVLDTWFSSSLFIFASLGWPKITKKIKKFYPTNIVVSGFDIIFFWISRIIIMSIYFIKKINKNINNIIPFKKIYITGIINDELGNKMSKSNNNTIDSIDIINGISLNNLIKKRTYNILNKNEKLNIINSTINYFPNGIKKYGADSLRYSLIKLSYSNNNNIKWNINLVKKYNNFCNKLWNLSKFVIKNTKEINFNKKIDFNNLNLEINKWILSELNNLIYKINTEVKNYRLDIYSDLIYNFTKNDFCNFYIESIKIFIKNKKELYEIFYILNYIFSEILKIFNPIIPFITEYIWQIINNKKLDIKINNKLLILQEFPKFNNLIKRNNNIIILKKIIYYIKKYKNNISFEFKINLNIKNEYLILIKNNIDIILKFTNINKIYINDKYNTFKVINKINLNNNIEILFLT